MTRKVATQIDYLPARVVLSHVMRFLLPLLLLFTINAAAQLPQCRGPKAVGFPLAGDYGGRGTRQSLREFRANPRADAPLPITLFYPSGASATNRAPVIFFSHAFGAINFVIYRDLIETIVSNGYAIVYVPYETSNSTNPARYEQLWAGFEFAASEFSNILDLTRVGFAGHSFGGGATPEMARRGAVRGWGTNGFFLFSMAPWYNWGTNMSQIPSSAKLVVQVYWDDDVNQHAIARNDIWDRLPQLTERRWQVIRAARGPCLLEAGHSVPTIGANESTEELINSHDAWGVWRRLHALADYTFTGNQTARRIAFGEDAFMGRFRGSFGTRPVAPLETTLTPVTNDTINVAFRWTQRCLFAQGFPCP